MANKKIWFLADLSSMVAREVLGLKVDNLEHKLLDFDNLYHN